MIKAHSMLVVAVLCTALCASVALAQQPQVLCGPSAQIITTPELQQSYAASLVPSTPIAWNIQRVGRRPYAVYDNGLRFALIPDEDYMAGYRERGGRGAGDRAITSDPAWYGTRPMGDFTWDKFVNCAENLTPVRSQGGRGLCHGFAAAAMLESLVKRRLMNLGVPEVLAEVDLSEEWMGFKSLRWMSEDYSGNPLLTGDGGWADSDLEQIDERGWALEAYWPYDPECWPEQDPPVYPCAVDFMGQPDPKTGVAWEFWAHRDPGQKLPSSVGSYYDFRAPEGPLPNIQPERIKCETDFDEILDLARQRIDKGKTSVLGMLWPENTMCNGALIYIPQGYPWAIWRKYRDGVAMTPAEEATWDTYHAGGHEVLLCGYGKAGTDVEGIWVFKNSHGLGSGLDGICYVTENYMELAFSALYTCDLAEETRDDLARFADTITK